ncbi:MAG: hypothetical protein A2V93_05370 [Ignavibacteria bacterium RBG_16_34_14]|nr:MAG: hypothetical protein A2V93_05370 [Ignavibacteria bacterium RBG_16_34_14]
MHIKFFFFLLLNCFTSLLYAQDNFFPQLPDGLGLSNQLEYSYDYELKREIFENWFNLDYRYNIFSAGIRFDIFQPNDPNPAISRGKVIYADIAFKYIEAEIGDVEEGMKVTAGNFYSLFGRGLILKSYENRNIRIDNNLLGVKIEGYYAGLKLIALTGMAENFYAERKDILHAVDLEYKIVNDLKISGSFASNDPEEDVARTMIGSIRIQPSIWNFDFYGEYGLKRNNDVKKEKFKNAANNIGEAYYSAANFYYGALSLVGEYKYYDNFIFGSYDGTIIYNNPPAIRKEYTYALLNRHPSPLNQNNEKGFQVEANYSFASETFLTVSYGETKTLGSDSYYQKVLGVNQPVRLQLKESFIQLNHTWNENIKTIAAFGYSEERDANTKNITPILENYFYIDEINTIKLIIEHQHTTDKTTTEKYYTDVATLEYLRSPLLSISVVSEMQTKEPDPGKTIRRFWNFIQFGYTLGEHTNLILLIGTRQAGNICIGGVCRYEPEFSGIEIKMFTRF